MVVCGVCTSLAQWRNCHRELDFGISSWFLNSAKLNSFRKFLLLRHSWSALFGCCVCVQEQRDVVLWARFEEADVNDVRLLRAEEQDPLKQIESALLLCIGRAAAYSKLQDHEKVVTDCSAAVRLDPNYSKAYGRMGWVSKAPARWTAAISWK